MHYCIVFRFRLGPTHIYTWPSNFVIINCSKRTDLLISASKVRPSPPFLHSWITLIKCFGAGRIFIHRQTSLSISRRRRSCSIQYANEVPEYGNQRWYNWHSFFGFRYYLQHEGNATQSFNGGPIKLIPWMSCCGSAVNQEGNKELGISTAATSNCLMTHPYNNSRTLVGWGGPSFRYFIFTAHERPTDRRELFLCII